MTTNSAKKSKDKRAINKGLLLLNKDSCHETGIFENSCFESANLSEVVFIINGGLTTNADNLIIMELFVSSGFDKIKEIIMVPEKQYSFAVFLDPLEAKKAVEALSGIKCLPASKHPLYMTCINKVPKPRNLLKYVKPPGLILIEKFISKEEEELLRNLVHWDKTPLSSEGCVLKHRQVHHFGYEFNYSLNAVDKTPQMENIPPQVMGICQRIVDRKLMSEFPNQLTINRYLAGQGIPPHVDTHSSFMNEIVSLSLLSGVAMEFGLERSKQNLSPSTNDENSSLTQCSVYLPPRSLCVMTGPARFLWTHGICPRKADVIPSSNEPNKLILKPRMERISFTFRKVRTGNCNCKFPSKCDSQQATTDASKAKLPELAQSPSDLEKQHVHEVYDKIADHFSDTRHKPWPNVWEFVNSLPIGTFLLDIGCGNGKYLGHNNGIFQVGCDTSAKLLDICATRNHIVTLMNCLSLTFRTASFDAVLCIAVIHHLASPERRRKAVSEIIRVLQFNGVCLIYVWAMEQTKGKMSAYLKQKRSNRKTCQENTTLKSTTDQSRETAAVLESRPSSAVAGETRFAENCNSLLVHENRTHFRAQNLLVPWKMRTKNFPVCNQESQPEHKNQPIYHRFYHVFKENELEEMLSKFPGIEILNSYYDEGNWCVLFKKIPP